MPRPNPTVAAVDEGVRQMIADAGGVVRLADVQAGLSRPRRRMLPVLLASGSYEVEPHDGVIYLKLREAGG